MRRWRDGPMPYAVRRARSWIWVALGFCLIGNVVPFFWQLHSRSVLAQVLVRLIWLVPYGVCMGMMLTGMFRAQRRAREAGYMICPRCDYDLRGRVADPNTQFPQPQTCPECGHSYTAKTLREAWEWRR